MAREVINIGTSANDHAGDTPRAAFAKVNRMTDELYNAYTLEVGPAAWSEPVAWSTGIVCEAGPPATVVTYNGSTYVCTTSHTAGGSFDALKFVQVAAKGDTGDPGAAATITVGTVTTGSAGGSSGVTNSGSSSAAVLDFTIPRGAAGADGVSGGAVTLTPSYSNTGGTGDRTNLINVTSSSGLLYAETIAPNNNLVDGGTGNNTSDSTGFVGTSASGAWIAFAWPAGSSKVINEITWKQSGTQTHGTWKLQGSNDDATWSDIGTTFTLGGATTQTITTPSANVLGYRYHRLLGVSGSTNAGPYLQEVEFKIGETVVHQFNQVVLHRRLWMSHTDQIISEWYFDEVGSTRIRDVRASNDIIFDSSFQSSYTSTPVWTPRGLYMALGMVQTPVVSSVRTIAILYRVKRDASGGGFILSAGASSGSGALCSAVSTTYSHTISHAHGIAPLIYDGSGAVAKQLNRGGWRLYFMELDQARSTKIAFGGKYDDTATTYRAEEIEIAWAACWSDQLTSGEQNTVLAGVRRIGVERGIYIHADDCPEQIDVAHLWGQSNGQGFGEISTASYGATLTAADQARTMPMSVLMSLGGSLAMPGFEQLQMGRNQRDAGFETRWIGPEMGAAWARDDDRASRPRRMLIHKHCIGSTYLYPSGGGVGAGMSWNVNEAVNLGLLYIALQHWWTVESQLLLRGMGPRSRALWWIQGEEDATSTTYSAAYQTNLQAFWDKLKLQLAYPPGFKFVVPRLRTDLRSDESFVNAAVLQVRAAHEAFVTANSSEAAWVDVDDLTMNNVLGQRAHYDAPGQKILGGRLYAAMPITDGLAQ